MARTRTKAVEKAKEKVLAALVDQLGELRARKNIIEEEEKKIQDQLASLSPGKYEGSEYVLTITQEVRLEFDKQKVWDFLSPEEFLDVAKVTSKVKDYIPPTKLHGFIAGQTVIRKHIVALKTKKEGR